MRVMRKDGSAISAADAKNMRATEVLTNADGMSQHYIAKRLKEAFPHLSIVGEEESVLSNYQEPHLPEALKTWFRGGGNKVFAALERDAAAESGVELDDWGDY